MKKQMFDEMMKAARERLADRDPAMISKNANVGYSGGEFHLCSLGINVTVIYPEYVIIPQLNPWHELVILHYLDLADGSPLTGKAITFGQQKEGMVRGGGFDRKAEKILSQLDFEALKTRCGELGAVERESNADYCVELMFLPIYPVTLNYWLPDEEFPASGRLLLDSSAEHYLSIEDSITVGEIVLEELMRK